VEAELAAMAPQTLQLSIFHWNARLARYAKTGQYEKIRQLFQQAQQEGIPLIVSILFKCSMHVQIYKHMKRADMYINRSPKVTGSQMSVWVVALLTCMPNVGVWRRLGEYSTKCLHAILSLGMPSFSDT
jgi:pentatricopeptide repeat protein